MSHALAGENAAPALKICDSTTPSPSIVITLVGTSVVCRVPSSYIDTAHDLDGPDSQQYQVNPPGSNSIFFSEGLSVPLLFSNEGINSAAVSGVTLTGATGSASLVTDELTDITQFEGDQPPVLYMIGTAIWYARQAKNSQDQTASDDAVSSTTTGDLTIAVTAGPVEPVTLSASPKNPKSGGSVTFTAAAPQIPDALYSWTFSAGGTATKPSITPTAIHSFTGSGTSFVVTVSVTGTGGLNGTESVTIVAGTKPPPKSPKPKPGTGKSNKKTAPSTGPATGGGNRVGGITSNTPSTSTSLTKGAQSTTSGPDTSQLNAQSAIDSLPFVSGRLIGGLTRTVSAKSLGQQETATAPAARIPPKWRLPLSAGAALVVILLLVGGATSEVRPTRRRRRLE